MRAIIMALLTVLALANPGHAQTDPVQELLQANAAEILKSSRTTIAPTIGALVDSGLPQVQRVLQRWQDKGMWQRQSDGLFFFGEETRDPDVTLFDFATDTEVGRFPKADLTQLKPNSGVRAMLGAALVQFQLSDPDPIHRRAALLAIQRDPEAGHLPALAAALDDEVPDIAALKAHLFSLLTARYGADAATRVAAIEGVAGMISVDVRATLNPLVATRREMVAGGPPGNVNIAAILDPGSAALSRDDAYAMLSAASLAPPRITPADMLATLNANITDGQVGGIALAALDTDATRTRAYEALAAAGQAADFVTDAEFDAALSAHTFYDAYAEPNPAVTDAARKALTAIDRNVALLQVADLTLDALSLAAIFFLAAIGLAITFGVMGVINMAHGEFITMGAYTGYVVQLIVPDYTLSILLALPLAFMVTFAAGVAMERLVIRFLYTRPLETLLATFGISIALQQIFKNVFGTQARPLTAPGWLDGAWVLNDVVGISYIRIAIFVLALLFLGVFLFIMKRTRLGLETRAVTQNPRMAASMGINPDRVNMLTFGLGSGIAGIAGVAIGLFAKVTSELGSDYIVQSFMTVVVGGVGNIFGALAGATMVGFLQKGIEWFNPSNTLAAQTYMIIFIIIFIQFRPKGIIALKGRAAGD